MQNVNLPLRCRRNLDSFRVDLEVDGGGGVTVSFNDFQMKKSKPPYLKARTYREREIHKENIPGEKKMIHWADFFILKKVNNP